MGYSGNLHGLIQTYSMHVCFSVESCLAPIDWVLEGHGLEDYCPQGSLKDEQTGPCLQRNPVFSPG